MAKNAKPTRRPTPRQVAAARENGRKGGRPRKDRGVADFDDLPAPPRHPLELGYWIERVQAIDMMRIQHGRGDKVMSKSLRGYTEAMSKILPAAIMMAALEGDEASDWQEVDPTAPPPEHPFGVAYWMALNLAAGVERLIRGKPDPQGAELRAAAKVYVKIIPPDTKFAAMRTLKKAIAVLGVSEGPELQPTPDDASPPVNLHED